MFNEFTGLNIPNELEDFMNIFNNSNSNEDIIIPQIKVSEEITEKAFEIKGNEQFYNQNLDLLNCNDISETDQKINETENFLIVQEGRPRSWSAPTSPASSEDAESNSSEILVQDPRCTIKMTDLNNEYKYDPRPLGKKRRRNLVPHDKKTREYWERRQRNNVAARRSREERRNKELETYQKMKFLEKENELLKETVNQFMKSQFDLQNEVQYLRQLLAMQNKQL